MAKKKFKKGVPTKVATNFYSTEFDCKCKSPDCQWTIIDMEHLEKLQEKRTKWNKSIKITSAYRCENHNKAVGGASRSRHLYGDATDIVVRDFSPDKVADLCEDFNGLGRYNTFTHIDSRPLQGKGKARWDFRRKK